MNTVRNFGVIAHIDHGKSTLADRMLEATGTIEKRKLVDQVLDSMDLERERGITIKLQPARMKYTKDGTEYTLNLIDTPGHIDFSYEVSRALTAVEGVLLLVDSTQGIEAQTLTTLAMARDLGRVIIPVLTKIDAATARPDEIAKDVAQLLSISENEILRTSGKSGEGVPLLLDAIVDRIPAPQSSHEKDFRSLIFDFEYSNHRGVIVYTRVFDGSVQSGDKLSFAASGKNVSALEVGVFTPTATPKDQLNAGEIGYIVTGIKEPGIASVGDTLQGEKSSLGALPGYQEPHPVVWASIYPESQDDFLQLRQALERLRLSDSSLSFEEESSGALGRGFRCGLLGMLHLEIVSERLRREFDLELIVTTPSVTYEVTYEDGKTESIYNPSRFPDESKKVSVSEPWVALSIIMPGEYLGNVMQLLYEHEGLVGNSETMGDERTMLSVEMPLRELMRGFFDRLKNVSSGFASVSYELLDMRPADVCRLDVLVAEELVPAFTRVVARRRVQEEAENAVEKLYKVLPRQQFATKIQGTGLGRILSSKTLSALKKNVTGHLYGGDITRKRKLWEKQKKGKKKRGEFAKVNIPQEVFMAMVKSE